jgi:hypothetical protein
MIPRIKEFQDGNGMVKTKKCKSIDQFSMIVSDCAKADTDVMHSAGIEECQRPS